MKTTISFLSILVLVILIGFYLTPANSNANLTYDNSCSCLIGYSEYGATVCLYLNNNLISCGPVNHPYGYFKICGGIDPNARYTVTSTKNGCTKTVNNATCQQTVYFAGVPSKCF